MAWDAVAPRPRRLRGWTPTNSAWHDCCQHKPSCDCTAARIASKVWTAWSETANSSSAAWMAGAAAASDFSTVDDIQEG
eukprot:9351570-Pyramimonas_sp.AAC.2